MSSSWKSRSRLALKPASLSFLSAGMNSATMEQASSKHCTLAVLGFQSWRGGKKQKPVRMEISGFGSSPS